MDTHPIRRFTQLRKNRPEISDLMLLNSNNQTKFTGDADVVVGGAGIIGLCYAIRLKNISPHLKIEVFEKSPAPVQNIGESTLLRSRDLRMAKSYLMITSFIFLVSKTACNFIVSTSTVCLSHQKILEDSICHFSLIGECLSLF
jgi:hypothetical protein